MPLPFQRAPRRAAVPISALPAPEEDDEDVPVAAPAQRPSQLGTTGGIVPQGAGTWDRPAPGRLSTDPAQRQQQSLQRAQNQFEDKQRQENPFLFSNDVKQLSKVGGRRYDDAAIRQGEQEYRQQVRGDRAAAALDTATYNSQVEAQFRGRGQQFYEDPLSKRLVPVLEDGTGRAMYHETAWAPAMHPKSNLPVFEKRDKYGQRQFKRPVLKDSPDPEDEHLYADMGDGESVPYMTKAEAAKSGDISLAKAGLAALKKQRTTRAMEAINGMRAVDETIDTEVLGAQQAADELQRQIDELAPKATNTGDTEVNRAAYQSRIEQLSGELQKQQDLLRPQSELKRRQRISKKSLGVARSRAALDAYTDQKAEIEARLAARGLAPEQYGTDPIYQQNMQGLQAAEQAVRGGEESIRTEEGLRKRLNPAAAADPVPNDLAAGEPAAVAARGGDRIGGVGVQEFARRYGSGEGPVSPQDTLKLFRRGREIEETLANEATQIDDKLRGSLLAEQQYVNQLYAQRLARLPADQQKRVQDTVALATEGTAKSVAKSAARGALSEGIYAAIEGGARLASNLEGAPALPIANFGGATLSSVGRDARGYANATRVVRDQIRQGLPLDEEFSRSLKGQIAQGVGQAAGTLPMAALGPGALAATSAGQIYDEAYSDAIQSGATPETAHSAAMKYLPAAALDYLSNKLIIGRIMKPLVGKATVGSVLKDILVSAASEGGTEGAQQAYLNQVASKLQGYDPNRPFDQEVYDSMLVGAVTGGAVTAAGQAGSAVVGQTPEDIGPADAPQAPIVPTPTGPADAVTPAPVVGPADQSPVAEFNEKLAAIPGGPQGDLRQRMQEGLNEQERAEMDRLLAESESVAEEPLEGAADRLIAANEPQAAPQPEAGPAPQEFLPQEEIDRLFALANEPTPPAAPSPSQPTPPIPPSLPQEAAPDVSAAEAAPVPGLAQDRAAYDSLQAQMRVLGPDAYGTPAYNALWQQSEDIKNRNAGMPPGEVAGGETETVTAPAILHKGKIVSGSETDDHISIGERISGTDAKFKMAKANSGFVTSSGRFVSRDEAYKIARKSGQVTQAKRATGELHSDGQGGFFKGSIEPADNWVRGESQRNSNGDLFFSTSDEIAGDFGETRPIKESERPKKTLTVDDKPALAEAIGYEGDPLAEPLDTPAANRFDSLAKTYAKKQGYDSIRYQNGTFGEPELHVFRDAQAPALPPSREQRLNDAGLDLPPISGMSRKAKRAELDAAGITTYKGRPLDEANPAEISAAVGKLRRGELTPEGEKPGTANAPLLTDRAIAALEKAKIDTRGKLYDATAGLPIAAYNAALDLAIVGLRAGRTIEQVVRLAIARYKAVHKAATDDEVASLEADIRNAANTPPEPTPTKQQPSRLPESLKASGAPVQSIDYDVRNQEERKEEASAIVKRDGPAKAEQALDDKSIPGDTRVAIGGQLINERMLALKDAKPEEVSRITRDIQRITAKMQPSLATEAGQQIAMFSAIYKDVRTASAMEYIRETTKKRVEAMGGESATNAAQDAADIFNQKLTDAERNKAIEALKSKYTEKPVRRMLNEFKRMETARKLNALGVLTRDDMVEVAGNALGLPGISQAKLKHLAEISDRIENAKTPAERHKAELELADILSIYKGVNPLDLEASILTLNILSGPTTQLANFEGNALNAFAQLGTTAIANPTKLRPLVDGLLDGIGLGVTQAKAILQTGRGTRDLQDKTSMAGSALQNVDYARDFPKTGPAAPLLTARARAVEKIGRFMKAVDAVFYYPAREAYARLATTKLLEGKFSGPELDRQVRKTLHITPEAFKSATEQAKSEGYEGIDLARRTSDIIEERRAETTEGKQAVNESERFAAEATYNQEPEGLAGVIYRNASNLVQQARIGGAPILKPWLMFLRVPANVFNATTNFTPMGAVRAELGVQSSKPGERRQFTKDERNRLYIQSIIGTTLMGAMIYRILEKDDIDVSAAGPSNPTQKKQLQQGGWLPYSIKVGGKYYSYKDSPLLVPLAIVGNVADAVKYQKSKEDLVLENRVTDAIAQAPQVIFQTSMLSGLADLMSSLSSKSGPQNLGRSLSSIPANLVIPYNRLLQQVDQVFDNKQYETGVMQRSVPFLRRSGPVKTDVQGRPETYDPFSRFGSAESKDPLDTLIRDKKVFVPDVQKGTKIGDRAMTDEEHTIYRRMSGQRIRARLSPLVAVMRGMTQEAAQDTIDRVSREERARAKEMVGRMPAVKR